MAVNKAAPVPPSSTTQPATAVVKAAPPSAGTVSVGSATSEWLSTGSAATTAGPPAKACTYSQGPEGPTCPTPTSNANESTLAASFAAEMESEFRLRHSGLAENGYASDNMSRHSMLNRQI